jgi:hypothetical protein
MEDHLKQEGIFTSAYDSNLGTLPTKEKGEIVSVLN